MKSGRIGVLLGGMGPERAVSKQSGAAILASLVRQGFDAVSIDAGTDLPQALDAAKIDVAFLALHGTFGEDGCVQGLLELKGIPYTGSKVLASALAFDKLKAKELFRLHNVQTPPYYVVDSHDVSKVHELHGSFGYPAFVKPRRSGSSVGAAQVLRAEELVPALQSAFTYDDSVLVERYVEGREIAVAVLDNRALGAVEIVPKASFYDYRSKYEQGESDYYYPARLSPTRYQGVLRIAERAAVALGTSGAVRIDILVTEGENEYVLEVNTLPGMTETSLLPKIAAGSGMDFDTLVREILERASLGHARTSRRTSSAGQIDAPSLSL